VKLQRCKECGYVITEDDNFREGIDDPDLCEGCNDEFSDLRA
jgi:predicted Zn-ribbon and HTH transcriptional regulator